MLSKSTKQKILYLNQDPEIDQPLYIRLFKFIPLIIFKHLIFDPKSQYADWLVFDGENLKLICLKCISDYRAMTKVEYWNRLKIFIRYPNIHSDPLGERGFVAWKSIPLGQQVPKKRITIN